MQQDCGAAGGAEVEPRPHIYDVFINHRGPDVKLTFAARLAEALCGAGFHPFLDAKSIKQGRHVFKSIDEALSGACVHVAIFSKRYAESVYCLEELWGMLQTKNVILPVFYDVNPEHLRRIDSGPFAEGFRKHESRGKHEEVKKWKEALREIANRRGYRKQDFAEDEDESQLIRSIVVAVHNEMPVNLQPQKRRFGLKESMKEVLGKIYTIGGDVGIIGLCGMGGIGKTTLAYEIYSHLVSRQEFQLHSFLKDVRSTAMSTLQRQLVRDLVLEDMDNSTKSYQHWFDAFSMQRVFIVVDDIDSISQFEQLIPRILQLCSGSLVLVTSRHRDVLTCTMGPANHKAIYEIKELNLVDSRELFNWHAFYSKTPSEGFHDVAEKVADACGGHPLALEVIGASLFDKKNSDDRIIWMDTLKILKENEDIMEKLRISYVTLPTDGDRAMFRDIACLMIGLRVEVAMEIWNSCQTCGDDCSTSKGPHLALRRLVDKALVKLNDGKLGMHDLMRDMGRDAVVKEAPLGCPGKRTLLWDFATASKVLRKNQGTDRVRGLKLSTVERKSITTFESRLFAPMDELHLLVLDGCAVVGDDFSRWSQEMRWLQWRWLPCANLPSHVKLPNLAVLDLTDSNNLSQLWQEDALLEFPLLERLILTNCRGLQELPQNMGQRLTRLRILQMENCSLITELPDTVGQLKYLERLILSGCENLTILPNAIVNLTKLEILMLNGCSNLKHLPKELGRLLNLVELHLTCCNKLHELPSSMVGMRMLKELHLQWTPVENLPEDFDQLTNLRTLFMSHLIKLPPRCEGFGSLVILDLANCKLEGSLPSSFGAFVALKTLNLQSNNVVAVEALPGCLQQLDMSNCHKLVNLPSFSGMSSLKFLSLCNCRVLTHIHGLEFLTALEEINLAGCISVIQSGLYIMHNRALRTCFLSGSKVAVKYDNAWSEKEPVLQLISYYGAAIEYLPSVPRKIKDNEWSYELLTETTISSNKECVAIVISFAGCDQGSSVIRDHAKNSLNFPMNQSHGMLFEENNLKANLRAGEDRRPAKENVRVKDRCYFVGRIMRGNKLVFCCQLFCLKHVDELNQVYLCTLRRHHPLVQLLQFGDKLCVHVRCTKRRWAITVQGALCVIHGENEAQVVAINSKLLSERQSKEFKNNLGELFLADNISSTLVDFLQDARLENNEFCMEQPTSKDLPGNKHIGDNNADVRRKDSSKILDQEGWIIPPEFGNYGWKQSWRLPTAGRGIISFSAEANNDVHVAISTQNGPHNPMYEIIIGGWNNRKTALRRTKQGHVLSFVSEGLLYPKGINQLWISINKRTSVIQIGQGEPYQGIISSYLDPLFLSKAQYVSFTTWDNPITYSHVMITDIDHIPSPSPYTLHEKIEQPIKHQRWTIAPLHGKYSWAQFWKLPSIGCGILSFVAEGISDIHIAISARPHTLESMYEIVIGGWNNTQTTIRKTIGVGIPSCCVEVGITSPTSCFWVSIDYRTSFIQIGRGEPGNNIFCSWKDTCFLVESYYFSFSTSTTPITYSNVAITTISE